MDLQWQSVVELDRRFSYKQIEICQTYSIYESHSLSNMATYTSFKDAEDGDMFTLQSIFLLNFFILFISYLLWAYSCHLAFASPFHFPVVNYLY